MEKKYATPGRRVRLQHSNPAGIQPTSVIPETGQRIKYTPIPNGTEGTIRRVPRRSEDPSGSLVSVAFERSIDVFVDVANLEAI